MTLAPCTVLAFGDSTFLGLIGTDGCLEEHSRKGALLQAYSTLLADCTTVT